MPSYRAQHHPNGIQESRSYETLRHPHSGRLAFIVAACIVLIVAGWQPSEVLAQGVGAEAKEAHSPFDQTTLVDPDNLWGTLAEYTYDRSRLFDFVVTFSKNVEALDGTEVTLQGFIIPLDEGVNIKHFLLSTFPLADCHFCLPGGPESFIEVRTEEPVPFTFQPVQIQGTLTVLEQDQIKELGLFYRMNEAKQVDDE